MDAALLFEAEAYRLDGPKLMGRQAAGNGFLRAAVAAHAGRPLWGYSPYSNSAEAFRKTVLELDPAGATEWIARNDMPRMAERGVLFRPDTELLDMAEFRLRLGPGRYSLCGLTHTLAGAPLKTFAASLTAPLAPWDAIICTSRSAVSVIEQVTAAQEEYLAWRLGVKGQGPRPQLPIIPLGVHVEDFGFSPEARAQARRTLGLADDEIAVLFAGRLVFHAKAHPFQMYEALEAAARATGKRIVLIQAGQAPNAPVETAYRKGMADFCPSIRPVFVDGKDFKRYGATWAASDVFMSLSDNIQETFGITPLEAMASGLPVLVSDWDGYRDTVTDGEVGFRIPTLAPEPGRSDHIAQAHQSGDLNYDYMVFRACMAVSVDRRALTEALVRLVANPDLRARMGAAGRQRVREIYDWREVYRRYQELWDELNAIRTREYAGRKDYWDRAPRSAAAHLDPFRAFAGFSSGVIEPTTQLVAAPQGATERYFQLEGHELFPRWKVGRSVIETVFAQLAAGPRSVGDLATATKLELGLMIEVVGRLLKMNLVEPARSSPPEAG